MYIYISHNILFVYMICKRYMYTCINDTYIYIQASEYIIYDICFHMHAMCIYVFAFVYSVKSMNDSIMCVM